VLGVNTRQLNGTEGERQENRLVAWDRMAMFRPGFVTGKVASYPRLTSLADSSASLEAKVRSYLDSNCAHCHRPDGVRSRFDARFETAPDAQGLICGTPQGALGIAGAQLVAPKDVSRSIVHRRLESLEPATRMPPLARNRRDEAALDAIRAWIEGLPGCSGMPESGLVRTRPQVR
jgi:mono/diheme cytochrome c family protein